MSNAPQVELARLKLLNEKRFITASLKYIREMLSNYGFEDKELMQLELVAEETSVSIIENSFDADESGYYDIAIIRQPNKIVLAFEDKGLPFDIKQLESNDEGALRLLLMKKIADELHFLNLGKNGKRIEIHKNLPAKTISEYTEQDLSPIDPETTRASDDVEFMLMTSEQSVALARCVYRSYGLTYAGDFIYYPEKIRELLDSRLLRSVVALNSEGELVAHLGLNFLSKDAKVGETGQAVVDPRYRGRGLFESMKKWLAKHSESIGDFGFYSEAVSIHPYTQKGNIALGGHETGIVLGYVPPNLTFKKIGDLGEGKRQTAVLFYLRVNEEPMRKVYLPKNHMEILGKIINENKLNREMKVIGDDFVVENEKSEIEVRVKPDWGQAHLIVHSFGADFADVIAYNLKDIIRRKIEYTYIDMPFSNPATAYFCPMLESLGFFFSGIIPELFDGDAFRLQYLNHVEIEADKICTASEFGKELLNYCLSERERVDGV
jgi:serine/threonine-protein kinase RsbW